MANARILAKTLKPLAEIADAYDQGRLDTDFSVETPADRVEIFSGRGGRQLLTLADAFTARDAIRTMNNLEEAVKPLTGIVRAYDANELDDEARKFWGVNLEKSNTTPTHDIELVNTDGGGRLLTLGHAQDAHLAYLEMRHGA